MNTSFAGPLYIVIAALLWAFDGVLRRSLFSLPPITIVFYEHLIGAILIAPFLIAKFKKEKLSRHEWGAIVWVSVLSGVLGTLWFTTALAKVNFISFSVVFLLQKLQPVFAIASARIILKEKITKQYTGWAVLAIAAAYFVTFPNGIVNVHTGTSTAIAALFAVGAAFAWGSSTAFSRYALLKHSGTVITGLRFVITAVMAFVLMIVMQQAIPTALPAGDQLFRLLLIALSTGLVALWLYYRGLKRTQTKIATVLELVFPLTAVIIDIFLYKTILAPSQYIAALVLLFAVYQVSRLNQLPERFIARVNRGRGKGAEMGFPTLNLAIPSGLYTKHGIYAGWVFIGDRRHRTAFHYGPVPVFDQKSASLEAHLLDVDLSETPFEVSFQLVRFLRDIQSFDTTESLVRQIGEDVVRTREVLKD